MSTDLRELFDEAGRTPPRPRWDADDVVRRGYALRRRRRAATVTASMAATAVLLAGVAFLASPGTGSGRTPAASSEPSASIATKAPTAGSPTPSSSGRAPSVTACRAADVRLALGTGGIAAGTSYRTVVASARSGGSCSLDGYPTVTLATADGTEVGPPAIRDQGATVHRVLLGNDRASFLLGFADTANFDPAACSPMPVTTMHVVLPGEPSVISLDLPSGTLTCSRDVSALGAPLVVGPWVSGSTGQ